MMRMMRHPNVCSLKAYFYNQGEKVTDNCFKSQQDLMYKVERRNIFKSSHGVCTRDSVQSSSSLCQNSTAYTHFAGQDLYVSII